jgi:hypothetical protein
MATMQFALLQVSISSTFYTRVFCTKVLLSSYVRAKKELSYEIRMRKMMMKLTTGAGNYFGPRSKSSIYLCFEGQIQVKYAK